MQGPRLMLQGLKLTPLHPRENPQDLTSALLLLSY